MPTEINIHAPTRRTKFENGVIVDHELNSLGAVLRSVQEALDRVRTASDPESHGYLDAAEYLVGVARPLRSSRTRAVSSFRPSIR